MTRADYIARVGGQLEAVDFECSALSIAREFLPPCALDVLAGRGDSPEYWTWLVGQLAAMERDVER
jgi:hypothetical protein